MKDDGGPPFPCTGEEQLEDSETRFFDRDHTGMSLREWFAGQAFGAFCTTGHSAELATDRA